MPLDFGVVVRAARVSDPSSISDVVTRAAAELGASDAVIYLVDFAQTSLEPLPDRSTHADLPHSEAVGATMAGRAFAEQRATWSERDGEVRMWVPVLEGSDRTGVLGITVPSATDDVVRECEALGLLVGYLIATQARCTDMYNLRRRRRSLSVAASMQWDLLPPLLLKTERVVVAGQLEPAYDVGGDCFDYAINGDVLEFGIFDPLGHGVQSSLMASLVVGGYRHDRREGLPLEQIHAHLDETIASELPGAFSTGQLGRIDLDTGVMTWVNAGHPLPLLVRGGRFIGELSADPSLPWGLGSLAPAPVELAVEALEPGDSVLFYTDGVVEAHAPGDDPFGSARLADLLGQFASDQLEPEEIVRRVVGAVLQHQNETLGDDATLVLIRWTGAAR